MSFVSLDCVALKVTWYRESDVNSLRAAVTPEYHPLCVVSEGDLALIQYGITQASLDKIRESESMCATCQMRVAVIAANGLIFTNSGLERMFALLVEAPADE